MKTSILSVILSWQVISGSLHPTECLRHCAAFDRGYAWGLDNGIGSEFECYGHGSAAFIAGCAAYIDDNLPDQSVSADPVDDDEEDHVLQDNDLGVRGRNEK